YFACASCGAGARVPSGANDDVKIPRLASVGPGISFAWNADALAVASSCLYAHFERLGTADHAFSMTDRASGNVFARSMATRTSHIELHAPAGLLDRPLALALRAHARLLDIAV